MATTTRPYNRALLPPNATRLQRELAELHTDGWAEMAAQVAPAAQPEVLLPWVVQHWQLSQFDAYFANPRELLANGLPWLRERGSAAAVRRAMGWLGYRGVKIEEDGPLLHIDPGREITAADLRQLAHVVKASIPLHVHFYRVFHRLDRRVLRFNRHPGINRGLLQADSGTPMDAGDGTTIIVSQGKFTGGIAPRLTGAQIVGSSGCAVGGRVRRSDCFILNFYRLGTPVRRPWAGTARAITAGLAPAYHRLACFGGNVQGQAQGNRVVSPLGQPIAGGMGAGGQDLPRIAPERTWETGGWDDGTWQTTGIAGGNIVIQE